MKRKIILVAALAALATVGCKGGPGYNLPPMERLMAPGPGVGGPGPGVLQASDFGGPGVRWLRIRRGPGTHAHGSSHVCQARWNAGLLGYHG